MSLVTNLQNLATRIATECKSLRTLVNGNASDLSALTTTAKGNLVAAVNELKSELDTLSSGSAGISDGTTGTGTTWSSQKISDALTTAIGNVLNGAPTALDTLKELADAIGDDANFATTVTTSLGVRLRFDTTQTLTSQQKANAIANIGAIAATDVGDTTANFVTTFEGGLV